MTNDVFEVLEELQDEDLYQDLDPIEELEDIPEVIEDLEEPEKPKKSKRTKNYLNNGDLMIEVKLSLHNEKMTNKLTHMLMMLTDRYGSQPKFSGYSFIDDMKAYALYMLCRTWNRFNPERSNNPFAFFTQCIKHSFYQYLNKEKLQRNIRDKMLVLSGMNPSHSYMIENNYEGCMFDSEASAGTLFDQYNGPEDFIDE